MTRKERNFITLRFRKKLDDDLKEAVKNLEDVILSDLVRESVLSLPASLYEIKQHDTALEGTEQPLVNPQRITSHTAGKPLLNTGKKKDGRG